MSNIKWGPKRECTGEQPCPDWVDVQIVTNHGNMSIFRASIVIWHDKLRYQLPAEYEALIAAKEPTHEQMREALASRYEAIPDALVEIEPVEIDPVEAAYYASGRVYGYEWNFLNDQLKDLFRAMFKAGQEHSKKSLD